MRKFLLEMEDLNTLYTSIHSPFFFRYQIIKNFFLLVLPFFVAKKKRKKEKIGMDFSRAIVLNVWWEWKFAEDEKKKPLISGVERDLLASFNMVMRQTSHAVSCKMLNFNCTKKAQKMEIVEKVFFFFFKKLLNFLGNNSVCFLVI